MLVVATERGREPAIREDDSAFGVFDPNRRRRVLEDRLQARLLDGERVLRALLFRDVEDDRADARHARPVADRKEGREQRFVFWPGDDDVLDRLAARDDAFEEGDEARGDLGEDLADAA